MIHIQISEPFQTKLSTAPLQTAARAAIARLSDPGEAELTIMISDDAHLQQFNRQFRGIDAPTDVLSFPFGERDLDTGLLYLGDVLISYPQALENSRQGGHSVEAELQLLIVHGVLHLLGHDHTGEAAKKEMWRIQAEILASIDCSISAPA